VTNPGAKMGSKQTRYARSGRKTYWSDFQASSVNLRFTKRKSPKAVLANLIDDFIEKERAKVKDTSLEESEDDSDLDDFSEQNRAQVEEDSLGDSDDEYEEEDFEEEEVSEENRDQDMGDASDIEMIDQTILCVVVYVNLMNFGFQQYPAPKDLCFITLNPASTVTSGTITPSFVRNKPGYQMTYCVMRNYIFNMRLHITHNRFFNFYLVPHQTTNSDALKNVENFNFSSLDWITAFKNFMHTHPNLTLVFAFGKTYGKDLWGSAPVSHIANDNLHLLHETLENFTGNQLALDIGPVSKSSPVSFACHPRRIKKRSDLLHVKLYKLDGKIGVKENDSIIES
jgi:hypothetical protein